LCGAAMGLPTKRDKTMEKQTFTFSATMDSDSRATGYYDIVRGEVEGQYCREIEAFSEVEALDEFIRDMPTSAFMAIWFDGELYEDHINYVLLVKDGKVEEYLRNFHNMDDERFERFCLNHPNIRFKV